MQQRNVKDSNISFSRTWKKTLLLSCQTSTRCHGLHLREFSWHLRRKFYARNQSKNQVLCGPPHASHSTSFDHIEDFTRRKVLRWNSFDFLNRFQINSRLWFEMLLGCPEGRCVYSEDHSLSSQTSAHQRSQVPAVWKCAL